MTGHRLSGFLVVGIALGFAACGGDSLTIPPTTGSLEITTTTAGTEPDPDGYILQIDAQQPQAIGAAATVRIDELAPGAHSVVLTGIAPNCGVVGDNPRTVTIVVGETTPATFELNCGATTGSLQVTAQTGGVSPDPDGYSINLDGTDRGPIGSNASVTVSNLAPGSHFVGLNGLAGNCHVEGDNLQAVTLASGQTAAVTFNITCEALPPTVGTIEITTSTTGQDLDADGYAFSVDGSQPQPISVNISTQVTGLAVGGHTVVLSNVADNCTVAGGLSKNVNVTAGAVAPVTFGITCSAVAPAPGAIQVTTATSGDDQDPNGYQLTVDGGSSQGIGRNETKNISNLTPGSHTVTLSDVATNCTAVELSQDVTVTSGATTNITFTVTCTAIPPTTGTIRVMTATSGESQDVNGYTFRVDAGASQSIGLNDSKQVNNVSAGSHSVTLSDVAANCAADELSKNVTVVAGTTLNVQFSITCNAAPSASQSNIAVDPNRIVAGLSSSDVIVTVRDAAGRRLSGVEVVPGSSGNGGMFTPTSLQTDDEGVAIFSFSSTESGAKTISATAGGVLIQDTEVISVDAQGTETVITSVVPVGDGTHTVNFTVTTDSGVTPTNGTVTVSSFQQSETTGCINVPVANGSCVMQLNTGDHQLQAVYTPATSQYEDSTSPLFPYTASP